MNFDHGIATISETSRLGLPLILPCIPSQPPVPLGTTFLSRLSSTDSPWSKVSPFERKSLENLTAEYMVDDGGCASYQSLATSSSSTSTEHLSVAFGITVGCKWLNASVTGGYDKDTLENNDARKTSTKASFRAGSIVIQKRPHLTDDARVVLKHGGGLTAFKQLYGDYYLAGYRLGGDTAFLVSESHSSTYTKEHLSVQVAARVLFIKASKTYEKFFHDSSATSSFQIMGFNTVTQNATRARSDAPLVSGSVEVLDQQLGSLETDCLKLVERVSKLVEEEGLLHGDEVSADRLKKLLASNLIVEIILLPVSTIREVQAWARSTDVIGY